MRIGLRMFAFVFCLVLPAAALAMPDSCGSLNAKLKNVAAPARQLIAPEPGKALFIFLQTEDTAGSYLDPAIATRIGLDGAWIGGNKGDSAFAYSVDPGEHHVCANWPTKSGTEWWLNGALAVTASAGKVYYFRIQVRFNRYSSAAPDQSLNLTLVDEDEGKYLEHSLAYSRVAIAR